MHSSMLCFLILLLLQFIQYLHMNDTGHGNLKCPVDYVGVVFFILWHSAKKLRKINCSNIYASFSFYAPLHKRAGRTFHWYDYAHSQQLPLLYPRKFAGVYSDPHVRPFVRP